MNGDDGKLNQHLLEQILEQGKEISKAIIAITELTVLYKQSSEKMDKLSADLEKMAVNMNKRNDEITYSVTQINTSINGRDGIYYELSSLKSRVLLLERREEKEDASEEKKGANNFTTYGIVLAASLSALFGTLTPLIINKLIVPAPQVHIEKTVNTK